MELYDELVARGLIAQVTNEPEIRKMINEGKATFYICLLYTSPFRQSWAAGSPVTWFGPVRARRAFGQPLSKFRNG